MAPNCVVLDVQRNLSEYGLPWGQFKGYTLFFEMARFRDQEEFPEQFGRLFCENTDLKTPETPKSPSHSEVAKK